MSKLLLSICIGGVAGLIDVTPMVMRQADRSAVLSAFLHWVAVGILTAYVQMPVAPWAKGVLVSLVTALPVVVQRVGESPQSAAGILAMSVLLGALIGLATARFVQ